MQKSLSQCFVLSKRANISFLEGLCKAFEKGIITPIFLKEKLRLGEIKDLTLR